MFYFVDYNGEYIASYKTLHGCLNFIGRRGYQDDADNTLRIVDQYGNLYNPITGSEM